MNLSIVTRAILCTLAVTGLISCGGSGGGSTSSTDSGSTVVGTIAGFGSIIMDNGVEYETDGLSNCEVDDDDVAGVCEDSLSAGMHVTLKTNANAVVTSLKYDDELEGVASNVVVAVGSADGSGDYTFEIYGVTVTTTSPETQWDDFGGNPPTIAELNLANIEVSGEWLKGGLNASYVEKQSDSSHEVKGTVGAITGSNFPLTLRNGNTINVAASLVSQLPVVGDFVEVKGSYDGTIFTATDIEIEDEDDFDGDSEAEITGTLIKTTGSPGYVIGSTKVDISGAPSCTGLIGFMVEAEGRYLDTGVLLVEECENEDDDMEARCQAMSVKISGASPKAGSLECYFPGTAGDPLIIKFNDSPGLAMFSDDSTASTFDLTNVRDGDCVEIKFSKAANGDYIAGLIEHEGSGGCDSTELEATVDLFNDGTDITVAGVKFATMATVYDPIGSNASLSVGDKVKIKDNDGNGNADIIEVDD